MNVLGISAFYHDSAACLLREGRIVAAVQEERFTRKKNDATFPENAVRYCLREGGITAEHLQAVVYYEKPLLKFNRLLETYLSFVPRGGRSFMQAVPLWLHEKLWIPDVIRQHLDYEGPLLFSNHHESHAASAFFLSPFDTAAILTMDGVGEWATASYGFGRGNRVSLQAELQFPHSLGLLYSAFTYFCGFEVNSGEYKLMGLAPYGNPVYAKTILSELIDLKEDGSLRMNLSYFNYCAGLTMTNRRFARLFGGPRRQPDAEITQREMDLAASIQNVTEEIVMRMARHVRNQTDERYLCLAGGVALNCVANAKLLEAGIFEDVWIQPAAGDAGGALGAALVGYHHFLDQPHKHLPSKFGNHVLLGTHYTHNQILEFLQEHPVPFHQFESDDALCRSIARHIADGKTVGWFQGRMEFGPRALGSRSILADPRSPHMQRTLNLKIKFRESFRPFAPAILREKASQWFQTDHESPYMLFVATIHPDKLVHLDNTEKRSTGLEQLGIARSKIPAVTHVDCSARLQTVSPGDYPLFYKLLEQFNEITGCPVLINTSFNVRDEPIVESPHDAYSCFMNTGLDVLAMGRCVLFKEEQRAGQSTARPEFARTHD